jgi:hypothetical protein
VEFFGYYGSIFDLFFWWIFDQPESTRPPRKGSAEQLEINAKNSKNILKTYFVASQLIEI